MIQRAFHIFLVTLLLIFSFLMFRLSLPYFSGRYDIEFLKTKQYIIHVKIWRYAFYIHIGLSILALIAGFTQFNSLLLKKRKQVHRFMGYVYVVDILFLAGPSGLVMSFYANGDLLAKLSFVILSLLWILFTWIAYLKIKRGKFKQHKNWMIRSYALTLSAISLRLYALMLPKLPHLNAFDQYALIAWLSWTLNLLVAELIILGARNKQASF